MTYEFSSLSRHKVNQHIEKKVFVFCEITYIDASEFNDTRSLEGCIWKKTELIYIFAYLTTLYFRLRHWASMTLAIAVKRNRSESILTYKIMSILMIIFVVVFSIWFVEKYFEVHVQSIFNLNGNVFTWCNIMQQCTITIHPW